MVPATLAAALEGISALAVRLAAVRSLAETLATGTGTPRAVGAEAALHQVLAGVAGEGSMQVREAAAEALWSTWNRPPSKDVGEHMRLGFAYMEKRHYQQAVDAFTEATRLDPSFVGGWSQRAMAQLSLRRFELAIRDCTKALELKPRHFGSLATMGMCHRGRGDSRSAVRCFGECLEVHPGLTSLRSVISDLERQITRTDISKQLWPRVVHAVQGLHEGSLAASEPRSGGLVCDWDVLRVLRKAQPAWDDSLHYVFRIRVENPASSSSSGPPVTEPEAKIRSLARFYVLRFAGGDIFPLTRLNNGPRIFELGPGEACRFSFRLLVGGPLRDAAGGMLLERSGAAGAQAKDASRFLDCVLPIVAPREATSDEVEQLRLGYTDVGELDVRKLKLRTPHGSSKL